MILLRVLGPGDSDAHPAWCRLLRSVFTRADFERWIAWGEWDDDYRAYTLMDGAEFIANVSITRMQLLIDGESRRGWQLGAVCVHPDHRGGGHARRLLDAVLASCGDDPVMLFANPNVRDFYPRFGFTPREEWIFMAEHTCTPAPQLAPRLDPSDPATRTLIHRLAATGLPATTRFSARGHGAVINWYLANGYALAPLQPCADVLVFCLQQDDLLIISEVLSSVEIDLPSLLPQLISAPIQRVQFRFTPERLWPTARAIEIDPEPDLYTRGLEPRGPHKFPLLAQT